MSICNIQRQNRILKEDLIAVIENYLKLLRNKIENPHKIISFVCELSNKRKLKFHFIDDGKTKGYDLELDGGENNHCIMLDNYYSDFDDLVKKIRQDLTELFFEYPL